MTRPSRFLVVFALVVMAVLAAGCGSDAIDGAADRLADEGESAPAEEEPAEEEPVEEEPVEEEPAPEEDDGGDAPEVDAPVEADGTDDGLSTEGWILAAILAVVVVGGLATYLSSSKKQAPASKPEVDSALNSRIGGIVGSSRWLHDQGSIEILQTNDPEQLRWVWNNVRERIVSLEADTAGAAGMAMESNSVLDRDLEYVGRSLAELRNALESNVSLRLNADETTDMHLVEQSSRLVDERRRQLYEATTVLSTDWR